MNRMNRRQFLSVFGTAAGAVSVMGATTALATTNLDATATTSLYVKGLVMVDLENPEFIRLGIPKAPGHKATLSIVPQAGAKRSLAIKGHGSVEANGIASTDPKIVVPELVRMKEFYGSSVKSKVDQCPSVISIPSNAIRSVTTAEVTKARYTFVRTDNQQEVNTFRPRQIAESIKIDLSSAATLKLDSGKVSIPLNTARELRLDFVPEKVETGVDPFADHFAHYFSYVDRPAALDFDVMPQKVGTSSRPTPRVGHHYVMLDEVVFCSLVAIP